MPHPKHRSTSSKGGRRRSHDALKKVQLTKCTKCNASVPQHTACAECGNYAGRRVLNKAANVEKKLAPKVSDKNQASK